MRQETGMGLLENRLKHNCSDSFVSETLYPSKEHFAEIYLENAVDPQNFEANLALDLEIADLINSKKGNAYGVSTLYQPHIPN